MQYNTLIKLMCSPTIKIPLFFKVGIKKEFKDDILLASSI